MPQDIQDAILGDQGFYQGRSSIGGAYDLKQFVVGVPVTQEDGSTVGMVLAVMDKTAVVQKDRKGEIIKDITTKDTEIIKLTQDPEKYFEAEVYPHVPDAIWAYEFDPEKKESATNKEKLGAEFPFTRFFYEYKEPEKADDLLAQFMELEKSLSEKIAALQESEGV